MVVFTTFVLGGLTRWMLNFLGMIATADGFVDSRSPGRSPRCAPELDPAELDPELDLNGKRAVEDRSVRFARFDERVLKPLFGGKDGPARSLRPALRVADAPQANREESISLRADDGAL